MFDREIIELNRVAFLRKVNLHVKCRQMESLQLSHIPFANVKNGCLKKKKRDGGIDVSFYERKRRLRSKNKTKKRNQEAGKWKIRGRRRRWKKVR